MKILVVDDDAELLGLISFALRAAGYDVSEATDGIAAMTRFRQEQPDLVILDVNLPGKNGFAVCAEMRAEAPTPILMLSVRNTEEDHVHGLDLGADDYLTKPFSPRTLLAHVRALLRRQGIVPSTAQEVGDLIINPEEHTVTVGGTTSHLTNREFRLLQYLAANVDRTLPVDRLTVHVWGYQGMGDRQLLKQVVHRVRQKIEQDPAEPRYLITVAGIGYTLRSSSVPPDGATTG
jgi:DNA-binding response OmpR family regulator